MCGINGIVRFEGKTPTETEISLMNKKIKHRGPDDDGVFIEGNVGLGHARLSIIDLSPRGHQPMIYEKDGKKAIIVFNGEIYNFQEIKNDLEKIGYQFSSTTDTEVILASYFEYGEDCVKKFNGMFAFVIYDKNKNILFGARDRFGKKPLKYFMDNKKFVFSSELKAILTQEIKREVDFEAINDFLTLQYVPAPRTGFKNIFKLPHASFFILNIKTKDFKIRKYWELDYSSKTNLSEKEITQELEKKFGESVKKRLIADVEIGAFLSGGIDSSAVVAFAARYQPKIKTFTIKFKEADFDESFYARSVADKYKTEHHEFLVSQQDMLKSIEDLVYQYEEPYADVSQLPTFILARKTAQYVKVVLNGDGGDENFGGYDKYEKHLVAQRIKNLPGANHFGKLASKLADATNSLFLQKVAIFLSTLKNSSACRHMNYTHYFDVFSKMSIYKDEWKEKFKNYQCKNFERILEGKNFDEMDKIFYLDFNTYVPDDLMAKVDIATMANGLESRSPLLDYEFVEFCTKIPHEMKMNLRNRKIIFKKMLEKYLSDEILYRKKRGFSVPVKHWFRKDLKNYTRGIILDENGLVSKIIKKEEVIEILQRHQKGQDQEKKIWAMLMLNLWYKKYINI